MAKAAVTRSIRDDHQKNFLKIFNGTLRVTLNG